ncbi:MAG: hypothetical protein Q9187_004425, partial [Circinaria calcarea]
IKNAGVMIAHSKPMGYPLAMVCCSLIVGATASQAMLEMNSRGGLLFMLSLAGLAYYGVSWRTYVLAVISLPRQLIRSFPPVFCAVCFKEKAEAILQMSEKQFEQMNEAFHEVSPELHCLATAAPVPKSYFVLFDDLVALVGSYFSR